MTEQEEMTDFDRWCYMARMPDGMPVLTHLIYHVAERSGKRFEIGVELLRLAWEAGRDNAKGKSS